MLDREDFERLKAKANPKKKKKRVKPRPFPVSYERILSIVRGWHTTGLRDKMKYLFILAYLTGARISELLQLRRMDFEEEEIAGKKFLCVQMLTLKESRSNLMRKLVIPIDGYDHELTEMIMREWLPKFYGPEKLFKCSRIHAWVSLNKINVGPLQAIVLYPGGAQIKFFDKFPCFPHFMRHCRITHLKKRYNFDDQYLMMWAGWASTRMATEYVHLNAEDMARKITAEMQDRAIREGAPFPVQAGHNQQASSSEAAAQQAPSSEAQQAEHKD